MNARIKELVGQAKLMAEESINRQISVNAELNAFAEKFAELLIRKCADVVETHDCNLSGNAGEMLQYFGVEE